MRRGSLEYRKKHKAYMQVYQKTQKYKAWRRAYLKTEAGKAYRNRGARKEYAKHRQWVDAYKLSKGCCRCGFKKWAEALDFDHVDRSTKAFNVSQRLRFSKGFLLKEIKKCQILCANCHRHKSKTTAPRGYREQFS